MRLLPLVYTGIVIHTPPPGAHAGNSEVFYPHCLDFIFNSPPPGGSDEPAVGEFMRGLFLCGFLLWGFVAERGYLSVGVFADVVLVGAGVRLARRARDADIRR